MTKPLRLMLVSYPRSISIVFERSVLNLARHVGPTFRLERCQHADEAPFLVRQWRRRGHDVKLLELLGHGKPGAFSLGDGLTFTADGTGLELAKAIGAELHVEARVHLLGCRVAAPGTSSWLVPFERALGEKRTLWGAPSWVSQVAFSKGPLDDAQQQALVRAAHLTPGKRNPRRPGVHLAGRGKTNGQ